MKRVAVDLTPLLPGGANGGIKPLALELVRRLAAHAPACEFVLLTAERSHAELALLDAPNVRRVCVLQGPEESPQPPPGQPPAAVFQTASLARRVALWILRKLLPARVVERLAALYARRFHPAPVESPLLRRLGADLLFCPFTGIFFYDPAVPVVSVVHDLQYLYYPQFFESTDRHERDRHFRHVCQVARRVVSISEYTRASVLEHGGISPERVVTIPSAPQKRLGAPAPSSVERIFSSLPLAAGRYLLYPANFWRHKNHELLLTAFGIYRAAHPQSDLKLVLTGEPSPRRDELMEATRRMGLAAQVLFAGYLPEEDFAALLGSAAAMIFPSLFEGFGMPVLEAMAAGVPVLCGNLTSLPEVAGDSAWLFDPRRPTEIVAAIERLETDPALREELIERGRRHAAEFLKPEEMAARYWAVFQDAAGHLPREAHAA